MTLGINLDCSLPGIYTHYTLLERLKSSCSYKMEKQSSRNYCLLFVKVFIPSQNIISPVPHYESDSGGACYTLLDYHTFLPTKAPMFATRPLHVIQKVGCCPPMIQRGHVILIFRSLILDFYRAAKHN